jgi:hypothetical protein
MNWTAYGAGGDGYGQQQAFAPQGAIGNAIGSAAPAVGTVLGSAFGLPMVGGMLGGLASQLSHFLPFGAGPQFAQPYGMPQFAPQGAVGNWINQLAPQLGGTVGGMFGQPQLGNVLGNLAGQLGSILPFAAGPQFPQQQYGMPQFAPQGAIGSWIHQLAPQLGGTVGGMFGQPQIGNVLGNLAGTLGSILPFAAGPQFPQQQQFMPQGALGNILQQLGPQLGGTVGGMFGQSGLGNVLGNLAGQFGGMLPFSAGPQFIPQGAIGNWISQLAPGIGSAAGSIFGQPQAGGFLGNLAGQLGSILPFSAAPQYVQPGPGYVTRPTIAN